MTEGSVVILTNCVEGSMRRGEAMALGQSNESDSSDEVADDRAAMKTEEVEGNTSDGISLPMKRSFASRRSLDKGDNELDEQDASRGLPPSGSSSEDVAGEEQSVPQHELIDSPEDQLKNKLRVLSRLTETASRGGLTLINLSRRGLQPDDAALITNAIALSPHLTVLKLGYNYLDNQGATAIAMSFRRTDGHHRSLSVLDLGFNCIGDEGCTALALHAIAGNHVIRTLYLSGNNIGEKGALSIAGALLHGSGLTQLYLSANAIGPDGVKALSGAIAESEAAATQVTRNGMNRREGNRRKVIEELFLGDTEMKSEGFLSLPSLILSATALRTLDVSNSCITDSDMAVFAQAVSQNKNAPLASIRLSFNQISCVGVECLMNAIWGSQTIRELRLDNNKIRDRGAQLCAVVLTSVNLELLDIGFNRVTTVGIKALMKNLSENNSLHSLMLSGIPIDQNASKAVSYALAYNSSLRSIYLDNCSAGYSAQRHIVAGIVSNSRISLRYLFGFQIGPITMTLGLPQLPETWTNEQVLGFVRLMWRQWRLKEEEQFRAGQHGPGSSSEGDDNSEQDASQPPSSRGPVPPAVVAQAAGSALVSLGNVLGEALSAESDANELSGKSPLVSANATMLERTPSGTLRDPHAEDALVPGISEKLGFRPHADSPGSALNGPFSDPVRRNRNLNWLRQHFRSLNEVCHLPFNNADLWQLHQYFFSPAYNASEEGDAKAKEGDNCPTPEKKDKEVNAAPPPTPMSSEAAMSGAMGRAISFQTLDEAIATAGFVTSGSTNKRRSMFEGSLDDSEPAAKRPKSLKPRIAYYPRIREKLESLGTKPSEQTLSLLRQLKFMENVMFQGKNFYANNETHEEPGQPAPSDVEMILLDLL